MFLVLFIGIYSVMVFVVSVSGMYYTLSFAQKTKVALNDGEKFGTNQKKYRHF